MPPTRISTAGADSKDKGLSSNRSTTASTAGPKKAKSKKKLQAPASGAIPEDAPADTAMDISDAPPVTCSVSIDISPVLQEDLEHLTTENAALKEELAQLKAVLEAARAAATAAGDSATAELKQALGMA